jgi:hypothetical protein
VQLNRELGALTFLRWRNLRLVQRVGFAVGATIVWVIGCSPANRDEMFAVGRSYRLTLHLTTPAHLVPESAAYFSPIVDSARLMLRVDSTSHNRVYATFTGELRHFPVVFRSIDDSAVVIELNRGHIRAWLSVKATDAGMELNGKREHDRLTGTWHTLAQSSADSGVFSISLGA